MASGTSGGGGKGIARLLAVVAAAALIVGGLVVRSAIDDGGGGGNGGDPTGSTEPPPPTVTAEVVCITELESVCEQFGLDSGVDVTIEPAGATLDTLAELQDPADAPLWITIDPFPAMVDELRTPTGAEPIGYESTPLAAAQIGPATEPDRWDQLVAECGATAVWRCLGDWAGDDWAEHGGEPAWGRVRPSVGDPLGTALGLASFAQAASGYSGSDTIDVPLLERDADFITWLDGLQDTVPIDRLTAGTPLATMLVRPSLLDVAASTDAEFASSGPSLTAGFEIQYPEPPMWATAVLAVPAGGSAPDGLADQLGTALREAGWSAAAEATPLPGAPTMLALRQLWSDF